MKPRLASLKSAIIVLILIFSSVFLFVAITGCKRNGILNAKTGTFNVDNAKEWYYGTFKNSAEWSRSSLKGKKLPDWKHGSYRRAGNLEILEFPLVSSVKSFLIPSSELATSDKKRLAEASVTRVSFIKTKSGKIFLRELDYIPEWGYLNKQNFDMSKASLAPEARFTGKVTVKNWDGTLVSSQDLVSGVIVRRGKGVRKVVTGSHDQPAAANCVTMQYCVWQLDCTITIYGDNMIVTECGEWFNTGDCWIETICETNGCEALTEEECNCITFGGCDGEGEGCTQEDIAQGNAQIDEQIQAFEASHELESSDVFDQTPEKRSITYYWVCLRQNLISYNYLISVDVAEQSKVNGQWEFTSIRHLDLQPHLTFVGVVCTAVLSNIRGIVHSKTWASMSFDAKVKLSALFKDCPISKERTIPCHQNFFI
jgi:hypothetical protein